MSEVIDFERLSYLGERVKKGDSSKAEKDEFMELLYQNGSITKTQYDDYKANRNLDEILNVALAVGAIALIGYLVSEIFKSK